MEFQTPVMTIFDLYHTPADCAREMFEWYDYGLNDRLPEFIEWLDVNSGTLPDWATKKNDTYPRVEFLASRFFDYLALDWCGATLNVEQRHLLNNDNSVFSFQCLRADMDTWIKGKHENITVYSKNAIDIEKDAGRIPKVVEDIILSVSKKKNGGLFSPVFSAVKCYGNLYSLSGPRIDWDVMEDRTCRAIQEYRMWEDRQYSDYGGYDTDTLLSDAYEGDWDAWDCRNS